MELTIEQRRVRSIIGEELTRWLEDYLTENIGEDILSAYHEGFTVEQVAKDLDESIKNWATGNDFEALTELVGECADEYLDEDSGDQDGEETEALERAAFGGHEDVWIEVDGHRQRVFGDPNMSEETKKRLAKVIRLAAESVSNGDFDNDE